MTTFDATPLAAMAFKVREHIIRLATDGGCFIGASLSCADLIVYLYNHFLNVNPDNLEDPDRDYLFLSKGHDVPALYGAFVEMGLLAAERLQHHLKTDDAIYWHPNRAIPGIEFHSGSLGHLLSVATGVALDCKLRGQSNKVVVITGDGELNEGSNWEACLVAAAYQLDNLVIVVDRNDFQANIRTEALIPLEPLAAKFEAFCGSLPPGPPKGGEKLEVPPAGGPGGPEEAVPTLGGPGRPEKAVPPPGGLGGPTSVTRRVDGHDFAALHQVFSQVPFAPERPSVVIADTVRGRGLPSIERRADRWFCNFTHDEIEQLLAELHGTRQAELTSETLVVR